MQTLRVCARRRRPPLPAGEKKNLTGEKKNLTGEKKNLTGDFRRKAV
jgi:hypothetical protein